MNRKAGLSYLELLIVLMLLAITATLIGGAFDFARQAKTRAIAYEAQETPIILRGLLRGWVENMSPVASENGFRGSVDGFSFSFAGGLRAKPLAKSIEIHFALNETNAAAIEIIGNNESGTEILRDTRIFAPALLSPSFSYYGAKPSQSPRWHEVWVEPRLPRLIRFQAARPNGSAMPPLVIRPAAAYHQSLISAPFPSPPT